MGGLPSLAVDRSGIRSLGEIETAQVINIFAFVIPHHIVMRYMLVLSMLMRETGILPHNAKSVYKNLP